MIMTGNNGQECEGAPCQQEPKSRR